jgi:hypothetical protein
MKQTLVEWLHGTRERQYSRLIPLPPMKERVRVALEVRERAWGCLCRTPIGWFQIIDEKVLESWRFDSSRRKVLLRVRQIGMQI